RSSAAPRRSTATDRFRRHPISWGIEGEASSPLVEAPEAPDRRACHRWLQPSLYARSVDAKRTRVRAAAAVFLATALASSARAAPPDELFDPLKAIEYDLYDFAPEEQSLWEESRWSRNSVRLDLGSVTLKELFATQELQVNLRALPWLGFHLDAQDDRTREAEVARFSADVLLRIAPGVELAVSGTPDVVKQDSAIGGALVLTSADRTRYAVLRLLDDAAFFNLQNPSGARRDSPVWRAQAEGRWASGPFSAWGRADLGTSSQVRFASSPPEGVQAASDQRSDLDGHLRWAEGGAAAGVR